MTGCPAPTLPGHCLPGAWPFFLDRTSPCPACHRGRVSCCGRACRHLTHLIRRRQWFWPHHTLSSETPLCNQDLMSIYPTAAPAHRLPTWNSFISYMLREYLLWVRHSSRAGGTAGPKQASSLSAWHSHPREDRGATVAGLRAETLEPSGFKSWL